VPEAPSQRCGYQWRVQKAVEQQGADRLALMLEQAVAACNRLPPQQSCDGVAVTTGQVTEQEI